MTFTRRFFLKLIGGSLFVNLAMPFPRFSSGDQDSPELSKKLPPFFLSDIQFLTLTAVASRIIPTGKDPEDDPGAKEVGTATYVDSLLLTFPMELGEAFRGILDYLEFESVSTYSRSFVRLTDEQADRILVRWSNDPQMAKAFNWLRVIAMEGFYSDYAQLGYRGKTAWGLVGYQAQHLWYGIDQMAVKKDWSFLRAHRK